jgi:uncharacterized SAM-dependent methyltransferase
MFLCSFSLLFELFNFTCSIGGYLPAVLCRQTVYVIELDRPFQFNAWEPIHTESSFKFSEAYILAFAQKNGFDTVTNFYDKKRYFADALWRVKKVSRI